MAVGFRVASRASGQIDRPGSGSDGQHNRFPMASSGIGIQVSLTMRMWLLSCWLTGLSFFWPASYWKRLTIFQVPWNPLRSMEGSGRRLGNGAGAKAVAPTRTARARRRRTHTGTLQGEWLAGPRARWL